MKKLIIAVAIVCAAMMSQAAAYAWSSSNSGSLGKLYNGDTNLAYGKVGGISMYMFCVDDYAKKTALSDALAGKLDTTKMATSTTLSSQSKITSKSFDYGTTGEKYDFYFVAILDTGKVYISNTMADKENPTSGSTPLTYADLASTSKSVTTFNASTYAGAAGVYSIPEPTSGLLLMLGMAGLALRRRRA